MAEEVTLAVVAGFHKDLLGDGGDGDGVAGSALVHEEAKGIAFGGLEAGGQHFAIRKCRRTCSLARSDLSGLCPSHRGTQQARKWLI